MQPEDLLSLKDDMVAFIEGHGMKRFPGFVSDDVPTVVWEDEINPDSWKDFVEMAKSASAAFITMSEAVLEKDDIDLLIESLRDLNFPGEEVGDIDEAQYLVHYVGKVGYLQLGFAYQGIAYLHESSTKWYDRYRRLLESVEAFGDIVLDDPSVGEDE